MHKILIVLITIFAFTLTGCTNEEKKVKVNNPRAEGNIHQYSSEPTDFYLLRNNTSNYQIVISEDATKVEKTAADELAVLFQEATNLLLPIISDAGLQFDNNSEYISIGNTKLLQEANISVEFDQLGSQGFKIITKEKTVFISGAKEYGTLYGVYEYLNQILDYDFFFKDCYQINKNVSTIRFYSYDIIDVPDIEYRDATYGFITENNAIANRYRMLNRTTFTIPINGYIGHNVLQYVPVEEYLEDHPEWYDNANKPNQLCYTAHGDKEEYQLLLNACFNTLKQALIDHPEKTIVFFASEDNPKFCNCPACQEEREKYGTDAAAMVKFINNLKELVDEWFGNEGKVYDRDLKIVFYAYLAYQLSPAIFDVEKDLYYPVDEEVICRDGVVPMVALINADYQFSLTDDENEQYYNIVRGWQACSSDIHFYLYDTNYTNFLIPYNTFDSMQDNYLMAIESGSSLMHNLGQPNQRGFSNGFSALKVYMESKLGWNGNIDYELYMNKFFDYYFQDASVWMRKFFDEYRLHSKVQQTLGNIGYNSIYKNVVEAKYWPQNTLDTWLEYINKALEKITYLKIVDSELYWSTYYRILGEGLFVYYLYVELYSNYTDPQVLLSMKNTVKEVADYYAMTNYKESSGAISILWNNWGI
ncbi:MAG: DUF4838 domain-containing protein [Clostridia bacterium]|nr:DUF4838 domain-containing protein [Clostridia bacterium]